MLLDAIMSMASWGTQTTDIWFDADMRDAWHRSSTPGMMHRVMCLLDERMVKSTPTLQDARAAF